MALTVSAVPLLPAALPVCIVDAVIYLSIEQWILQDLSELYLAPSLKLAQQHLQPLLDEAADIQQRLAALGC